MTTASAMTTGQIFEPASVVKSPNAPPIPPTAVSVAVAFAKESLMETSSSPRSRLIGVVAACFGTTMIMPAVPPPSRFTTEAAWLRSEAGAPETAASTK